VLASDGSHYYSNMDKGRPFPVVASVTEMVDGWRRVRALASDVRHVVPGHDPLVMKKYRAPDARLEGIAVRLDAEPAP
jgi:glyoxylase-like metal-dependent hydrolase (beta-lactamase superfamily II)